MAPLVVGCAFGVCRACMRREGGLKLSRGSDPLRADLKGKKTWLHEHVWRIACGQKSVAVRARVSRDKRQLPDGLVLWH